MHFVYSLAATVINKHHNEVVMSAAKIVWVCQLKKKLHYLYMAVLFYKLTSAVEVIERYNSKYHVLIDKNVFVQCNNTAELHFA